MATQIIKDDNFPEVFERLIADSGLSYAEVARRARLDWSALRKYRRGDTIPTFATMRRLVEATGHRLIVTAS